MTRKIYTMAMVFAAGLLLFVAQPVHAFTSESAGDAYIVLTSDPTAVMLDTRTVDEHNGYCPPWSSTCGGLIDTDAAYAGTPQWTVGGVEELAITVPYWSAGETRVAPGPPEDEAQVRNIIEGLLSAGVIGFDTPIYFICRTAYRSYYMAEWMDSQTFTNAATEVTDSFTNLINIDADGTPGGGLGGMQEWNAGGLPIYNGTLVPPQVFSGYPEDGYTETGTHDVIFAVGVLEPTTGGFVYPEVTDILLYIDGNVPVAMTAVDELTLRLIFGIPADVYIPGTVYTATENLPNGTYAWNASATNSAGTGWNLNVLDGTIEGPDGPGVRILTVDVAAACTDDDGDGFSVEGGDCGLVDCNDTDPTINPNVADFCDRVDNDCDGLVDEDYVSTPTTCGVGECSSNGQLECVEGGEVDTCVEGTPGTEGPGDATCSDSIDNDCDGLTDGSDPDCAVVVCTDNDGDGYAQEGGDCGAVDCDDSDSAVNPGATEGPSGDPTCSDAKDNDCDGQIDLDDRDCQDEGRRMRGRRGRRGHGGRW